MVDNLDRRYKGNKILAEKVPTQHLLRRHFFCASVLSTMSFHRDLKSIKYPEKDSYNRQRKGIIDAIIL